MVTYYVGSDAVALGLAGNEKERPDTLVKRCLTEHGIAPWEQIESEIFLSGGESLLIARPRAPRRQRLGPGVPRLRRH